MEELVLNNASAQIDKGELISYKVDDHEFIHQKGSAGWRNSDTEMFPIIGPTNEADFQVQTAKGNAVQDQHGLLRELEYELLSQDSISATYEKNYRANSKVINSKYPAKSTARELFWPYDFHFQKSYSLSADALVISFRIAAEEGMPFMLGYHPAFKLHSENASIGTKDGDISIQEVMAVGSRAMQLSNCDRISLKDKENLSIKTEGFGNFMLWTEVPNMVCIEPITFYPYALEAKQLHYGFDVMGKDPRDFMVFLKPE